MYKNIRFSMSETIERFEQVKRTLVDIRPEARNENAFGKKNSRAMPYPQLRMLAGYIMCKEGYSSSKVGKCLGIAHSTVSISCKKMNEILASTYPPDEWIRDCYRKTVAALPLFKESSLELIPKEDVRNAVTEVFKTGELTENGYKSLCDTLCI